MPLTEQQQAKAWVLLAGLVGAMARLPFERNLTWKQTATMIFVGGAVSAFFSEPINNLIPGHSQQTHAVIAFLLGLLGYRVVGVIVQTFDKRAPELAEDGVDAVRTRFFPNRKTTDSTRNEGTSNGEGDTTQPSEGGEG